MTHNIGSAFLILGSVYLNAVHGLHIIPAVIFVMIGLATWAYYGFSDERQEYLRSMVKYYEAKAEYYDQRRKVLIEEK